MSSRQSACAGIWPFRLGPGPQLIAAGLRARLGEQLPGRQGARRAHGAEPDGQQLVRIGCPQRGTPLAEPSNIWALRGSVNKSSTMFA